MDFDPQENIGNAVKCTTELVKNSEGKDTGEKVVKYEFHLGDFALFGDFLQELIGKEQFKIEENGK